MLRKFWEWLKRDTRDGNGWSVTGLAVGLFSWPFAVLVCGVSFGWAIVGTLIFGAIYGLYVAPCYSWTDGLAAGLGFYAGSLLGAGVAAFTSAFG